MIKLAPSVLAADFSRLGEEIKKVHENGAEYLHLDVMDGMFVPNISLGPGMISSIRKVSDIVFDVHLMIQDPIRYIDDFAKAGADIITFHYEACDNHKEVIDKIHSYGIRAGMSVKPYTDANLMVPFLPDLELALIMTVQPGFGGQKFMPEAMPNLEKLNAAIRSLGKEMDLEVDGGINLENACIVKERGANVLVAGSAVFGAKDVAATVRDFLK
ncbi:MAG: ribulose-phosphate 3-epimerase [Clostridia bacterium]|nr:ribulose-phosphate 3-epimerase [Clostridia bacterium]